jgi:hypothetical protein
MPRIPKEISTAIENGEVEEGGGRRVYEGYALAKLVEAEETDEKDSGYAGQDLKFEIVRPRSAKGTPVWEYISYSPAAAWKWKSLFEAFGFEPDSDTDELIEAGEDESDPAYAIIDCVLETQKQGKNKGRDKTKIQDYLDPNDAENSDLVGE